MARHRPTCSSRAIRTSTGGRRTSSRWGLVRDTQVSIDGVILLAHALDGSVAVRETRGNLGREGLGMGCCGRGHRQVRRLPRRAGRPRPF